MDAIAESMARLAPRDGVITTELSGVRVCRMSTPILRSPLMYHQGAIIVGQGTKRVYLGEQVYEYNPDRYLVLSVPIPAECEAEPTRENPFLALAVDFDPVVIGRLVGEMGLGGESGGQSGLVLAHADASFKSTLLRLLSALADPVEGKVIGPGLVRELMFRMLCGEAAPSLAALSVQTTNLSRIEKALQRIHEDFASRLDVDQLAGLVNMSPSAFHRTFKEVTASSPIQYLKKVRLDRARHLITDAHLRVGEAARRVGYESDSQFSREFKRYFGESPARFAGGLRV